MQFKFRINNDAIGLFLQFLDSGLATMDVDQAEQRCTLNVNMAICLFSTVQMITTWRQTSLSRDFIDLFEILLNYTLTPDQHTTGI